MPCTCSITIGGAWARCGACPQGRSSLVPKSYHSCLHVSPLLSLYFSLSLSATLHPFTHQDHILPQAYVVMPSSAEAAAAADRLDHR